jgi:hypothetical protein
LRISESFFERAAVQILERLQKKELLLPKGDQKQAVEAIKEILVKNFREEQEIEMEAEKTMETLVKGKGEYDRHKMLLLLKSRIAAQRGFIL